MIYGGNKPNCKTLVSILKKLNEVDVHIYSKSFYVIGTSCDIVNCNKENLDIKCSTTT